MTNSLNEQGIKIGDYGFEVSPNRVILSLTNAEVKLPMSVFKKFAEWYFEEQNLI